MQFLSIFYHIHVLVLMTSTSKPESTPFQRLTSFFGHETEDMIISYICKVHLLQHFRLHNHRDSRLCK
uniref:Uncharacterized protein n=1 Tax=Octopus bimaculoides TaxID=37653 RepID=A0A0L8IAX2_OCTBM